MKETTKSFLTLIVVILFFGLILYVSPNRQASKTIVQHCQSTEANCKREVAAIKYYVDSKVAQSNIEIAKLRKQLEEEKSHNSEIAIEVAQVFISVGDLNDKIAELEMKAAIIDRNLNAISQIVQISLQDNEAISKKLDDTANALIIMWKTYITDHNTHSKQLDKLQSEIETLKKQVDDLSKRPHSVVVKKTTITPIKCIKKRIFCR